MPPELTQYLVVSYDPDEEQWFHDFVAAIDGPRAEAMVLAARDYVIAANALNVDDVHNFERLFLDETPKDTARKWRLWKIELRH
jgi:hypothetical protein